MPTTERHAGLADKPSAFDHFLFLLSEMERVADRQDIRWPDGHTSAIKTRLAYILLKVGEPRLHDTGPEKRA
jgi:hypothetical protein